jgi:hypothetical protein
MVYIFQYNFHINGVNSMDVPHMKTFELKDFHETWYEHHINKGHLFFLNPHDLSVCVTDYK